MKNKFTIYLVALLLIFSHIDLFSQNIGSATYIEVNDIYLPFNNRGVIADVNVPAKWFRWSIC